MFIQHLLKSTTSAGDWGYKGPTRSQGSALMEMVMLLETSVSDSTQLSSQSLL